MYQAEALRKQWDSASASVAWHVAEFWSRKAAP